MSKTSDAAPADKSNDKAAQAVGPFVLASFARLQEAIDTDQGPIEIALRLKEHEEAIRRACEAEKARHPQRAVDASRPASPSAADLRAITVDWPRTNARRGALMDREDAGTLTAEETTELADLQRLADLLVDKMHRDASRPVLTEEQARRMAEQAMLSPMSGDWIDQIAAMLLCVSRGDYSTGNVAAPKASKEDPSAGLPEQERKRIVAAAEKARAEVGMRSTAPWAGQAAYETTIEREVAAYHARQGISETLTREEAEKRLRALDVTEGGIADYLDHPRDWLNAYRPDDFHGEDRAHQDRIAAVLQAYVRGLDAQGAAA